MCGKVTIYGSSPYKGLTQGNTTALPGARCGWVSEPEMDLQVHWIWTGRHSLNSAGPGPMAPGGPLHLAAPRDIRQSLLTLMYSFTTVCSQNRIHPFWYIEIFIFSLNIHRAAMTLWPNIVWPPTPIQRKPTETCTSLDLWMCAVASRNMGCMALSADSLNPASWERWSLLMSDLSSISHRCLAGLRSGEFRGYVTILNLLLCSPNHPWNIYALWKGLFSYSFHERWSTMVRVQVCQILQLGHYSCFQHHLSEKHVD